MQVAGYSILFRPNLNGAHIQIFELLLAQKFPEIKEQTEIIVNLSFFFSK